jgi:AraC-like DNA-binding protein
MANSSVREHLYDPRQGGQAIRIEGLRLGRKPFEPARTNYFSIYLIEAGAGTFWADAPQFVFGPDQLLFFVPYQHIRFAPSAPVRAELIQFHANFLCVETFHAEVGCSGLLFNDPYGVPAVHLHESAKTEVKALVDCLRKEHQEQQLAHSEAMLAYLKVLLILATRLKSPEGGSCRASTADVRHPLLAQFRDLIEQNYRSLHAPADYAKRLHVTAKTLGRIVREHLGTTPTDLIRNRILIHAKWQLLHTLKPVKEIAREVGFSDELYFSRLFKRATGYSPIFFREFETEIRGGSNLSMSSSHAPIHASASAADT